MGDTNNISVRSKRPSDEDIDNYSSPINKKKHTNQLNNYNNNNITTKINNNMAIPNINMQNKFSVLNHDESLDDDNMDDDELNNTSSKPKRRDRIPIVVSTLNYNQAQNQKIRVAVINVAPNVNLKYTRTKLIFYTYTKKEHQMIMNKLKELDTPFHTFERFEDKMKKMVLKGLPPLNEDDINNSIQDQGLVPVKITKMKTKNENIPVYQVNFNHDTEINKIMNIKYVCHVKATWKKYQNPKQMTQCYKCQEFGHGSTFCNNIPKCVKCAGEHLTNNCTITAPNSELIKCANCGKNHVASFTGCEKYIKQLEIIKGKRQNNNIKVHQQTSAPPPTVCSTNFPPLRNRYANTNTHQAAPTHQANVQRLYNE